MATFAVASFVLVSYAVVVSTEPGPTPGDTTAMEIAEQLRTGWLVHVAKLVTSLGSNAIVLPLAAVCAAILAARRRWAELGVLAVGIAAMLFGIHAIKYAFDRPRPEGGLVAVSGSSFPSGHAAHSVFYLWLAVTVVIRLRPGMARGALVVTAGVVLTALIGLSRVYLGVHYMSDVSAGWALGAAAFSLCAAIALVITTMRSMRAPHRSSDGAVRQNGDHAAAGPAEDRK
jgi:undecaprenyl-diphosphatase